MKAVLTTLCPYGTGTLGSIDILLTTLCPYGMIVPRSQRGLMSLATTNASARS
jgi:hypothetical protein